MISVVCPTVTGREAHYERCLRTYVDTVDSSGHKLEWLFWKDQPTCGIVWQEGATEARGEYIHFTADDLEPHRGWAEAAIRAADEGIIPMPTIYNPSGAIEPLGSLTQGCTRIPFCTREQWKKIGPMIPLHYYTDNWFSEMARRAGYCLQEVPEFVFTHHWAQPARGAGMSQSERMIHDEQKFHQYLVRGYDGKQLEYGTTP